MLDEDGLPLDEAGSWAKEKHERLRKYVDISRAAAACRRAAALARRARLKAEVERRDEASLRALETVNRAMADLNRYCAARAKAGQPTLRDDDRVAQLLVRMVEITTERWQALLAG